MDIHEELQFDPSIANLIEHVDSDWGKDPTENAKSLIPYGINIIDQMTYGMDFGSGGLIVMQGGEKQRKTTVVANIIKNVLTCGRWPQDHRISVDLAESGLPPRKYRDILISMVATDLLVRWHFDGVGSLNLTKSVPYDYPPFPDKNVAIPSRHILDGVEGIGIDYKFLRFRARTPLQMKAIHHAMEIIKGWPLDVYGPAKDQGKTRDLDFARTRWNHAVDRGTRLFVYDNIQQFQSSSVAPGDYDKLLAVVPIIAGHVVETPGTVFIAVSQTSMTTRREARQGVGKTYARGGTYLAEEANSVFNVSYKEEEPMEIYIDLLESRDSAPVTVRQGIEPTSGLFIGRATMG